MFTLKPIYHTIEIGDSFRFSTDKVMTLNEVLLRILGDEYMYCGSIEAIGFDIIWIKTDEANKLENLPSFISDYNNIPVTYELV